MKRSRGEDGKRRGRGRWDGKIKVEGRMIPKCVRPLSGGRPSAARTRFSRLSAGPSEGRGQMMQDAATGRVPDGSRERTHAGAVLGGPPQHLPSVPLGLYRRVDQPPARGAPVVPCGIATCSAGRQSRAQRRSGHRRPHAHAQPSLPRCGTSAACAPSGYRTRSARHTRARSAAQSQGPRNRRADQERKEGPAAYENRGVRRFQRSGRLRAIWRGVARGPS